MLKKTITYTDLYDNEVTEDFYFNLTEAEIATLEISKNGGYAEYLQSIVNAQDGEEIANQLKSIVLKAYGKPSDDGKRFVKSEQLSEEFYQTNAYSELIMSFFRDAKEAAAFMVGVMPKKIREQASANADTITESVNPELRSAVKDALSSGQPQASVPVSSAERGSMTTIAYDESIPVSNIIASNITASNVDVPNTFMPNPGMYTVVNNPNEIK